MRSLEARLAKVELAVVPQVMAHEDWLELLDSRPPLTEAERVVMDDEAEAKAIAEFGSLAAATLTAKGKAKRIKDPRDAMAALVLEVLLERREGQHAFA